MNLDAIFKAYDVRGVYPTELNEELAVKIGKAFAQFVEEDTIMLGHDMRESAPSLLQALIDGITSQGKNVKLAGLMPTDASYYSAGTYNLPMLMLTASHNPGEYNGMKFTKAGAEPIGIESGLAEIRDMVAGNEFEDAPEKGTVEEIEVIEGFIKHALSMIDTSAIKPFKIAVDAGNGMGGFIAPKVFAHLPVEIIPMYFELDGSFPNHEPNPIDPENVKDLQAKVKEEGCNLGIAFDGDADRAYFIDEKGGRVSASLVTAMIAKNVLVKNPGASIIYNVPASKVIKEVIEENGGTAIRDKVGHSYIKKTMKETGALFGGEHSGHFYFYDNFRADSGLIAALIVIEMLSNAGVPFSELLAEFERYYAIEETNSAVEDKDAVLARLREQYADADIDDLDGLTFVYDNFWFNVRPSNTEPKLRLNLEANTPELRDEKAEEVLALIRQ